MSARIAKLPHLPEMPPPTSAPWSDGDEEDVEEGEADNLGQLPTFQSSLVYVSFGPIDVSPEKLTLPLGIARPRHSEAHC